MTAMTTNSRLEPKIDVSEPNSEIISVMQVATKKALKPRIKMLRLVHSAPDQPVLGTQTPLVGGVPFNVQRS